jgi:hypothetical protein
MDRFRRCRHDIGQPSSLRIAISRDDPEYGIALTEDSHQATVFDHHHCADLSSFHQFRGFADGGVRRSSNKLPLFHYRSDRLT